LGQHITHIGMELRAARKAMGLSYNDVSETTRIQPQFLCAIENLSKSELPSIGYVLGYVRSYAKAVGLDGAEAVARYKIDSEVPENLGMRDRPHFVPVRKIRLPRGFVPAMSVVAVAAMLTVWYGLQTETQAFNPVTPDFSAQALNNAVAPLTLGDPNMLTLKVLAPSWVQIKDAKGGVIISRIFVTNETWQAPLGTGATISARDGGAIQIFVGEGDAGLLGERGVAITDVPLAQ